MSSSLTVAVKYRGRPAGPLAAAYRRVYEFRVTNTWICTLAAKLREITVGYASRVSNRPCSRPLKRLTKRRERNSLLLYLLYFTLALWGLE